MKTNSIRDTDLAAFASSQDLNYFAGSIYGEEFRNFKLLSAITIDKAHNVIKNHDYIVADLVATERMNLDGGGKEFTAFPMNRNGIPKFRLGVMSFFDTIQDVVQQQDIKFESHPSFSNYYLLTSEDEAGTRKVFTPEVPNLMEAVRKFKIEVNDDFMLIFGNQQLKSVQEIDSLIAFSIKFSEMIHRNLN
jgi:hypothetical protein